jgi:hypothetical protein
MAGNHRDGQPDGVVVDFDGAGGASWWEAGVRRRSIRWNRAGVATYEEVADGGEERVTMRHNSGALKATMTWRDDDIDGRYETWHESGQKRLEGRYERGKRVGAWTCWDEQGAALHASYDDAGELLGLDGEATAAWRGCVRPIGSKDPAAPEVPAAIE